jgi:hypothetical protein
MKKMIPWLIVTAWMISSLVLQGCGASNKELVKRDFSALEPIKVCRMETPGIMKSTGTETALLALVTLGAPGGSALLVVGDEYAKARGSGTQDQVYDFGALVMDKFLERIKKDRPDWPALTAVQAPLKEEPSDKCTVIEFKVSRIAYGSIDLTRGAIALERGLNKGLFTKGLMTKTLVTMKDPQGEVLWQRSYLYLSEDFGREKSMEELEADHYKKLKEEMVFAADKTVSDFIADLNGDHKHSSNK